MPATAAKKIDSVVHGVQFGLQSYIFTVIGLPQEGILDLVIRSMVESGLGECELYAPLVEPAQFWNAAARAQGRDELAKWRMSVSLDYFRAERGRWKAIW